MSDILFFFHFLLHIIIEFVKYLEPLCTFHFSSLHTNISISELILNLNKKITSNSHLISKHFLQECPLIFFFPQSPSKNVIDLLHFICRCMFIEEKYIKLIHVYVLIHLLSTCFDKINILLLCICY